MAVLVVACILFAGAALFVRMALWALALLEFGRAAVSGAAQPSHPGGGELTKERETFGSR